MFEHLDDPAPYAPPAGLRTAVRDQVRRRHRRRVAVAGGVASVAILGVGVVTAVRGRLEPQQIEVGGLADDAGGDEDVAVRGPDPVDPGDPVTILVVGVDEDDGAGMAPDGSEPWTAYADSIGLVRIDPEAGEVRLLSVPRDLWVEADGVEMRVSQTFATGGPTRLIGALDATLGTPIDHYVQVDFAGARELVDALGGIRVAVDRPIRDDQTGMALDAGCHTLDGTAALALGRSRSVEVRQDDGSWVRDPSSAIGREVRGVGVAAALLQAAGRVGVGDLPGLVRTGLGSITVDDSLDTDDLERWARDARDDRFVPLGLPVVDDLVGEAQVLRLGDAGVVLDAFSDGGADPIPILVEGTPVLETNGLRPC